MTMTIAVHSCIAAFVANISKMLRSASKITSSMMMTPTVTRSNAITVGGSVMSGNIGSIMSINDNNNNNNNNNNLQMMTNISSSSSSSSPSSPSSLTSSSMTPFSSMSSMVKSSSSSRLNTSGIFKAIPSLINKNDLKMNGFEAAGMASTVFGGPAGRGQYVPAHQKGLPLNLGVLIVPQQEAWVVERLGKYHKILDPGLSFLIPILDRVAYRHTLKEVALEIPDQTAITQDNVSLLMDGVLYYRVKDAEKASYGVEDPQFAIMQMAVTTMRSEIGKISLDKTFEEREALNANIVTAINHAAGGWGIECMRYEIRDITPPSSVLNAMELQVAAERKKRAQILDSEGVQASEINIAEGQKQSTVLQSEGEMIQRINAARGEAEAIAKLAEAKADSIRAIAESTRATGGSNAIALKVAEEYIAAFSELAKTNNTMLLPANASDPSSMIAQAMAIYKNVGGSSSSEMPGGSTATPGGDHGDDHGDSAPAMLSDADADAVVREAYAQAQAQQEQQS